MTRFERYVITITIAAAVNALLLGAVLSSHRAATDRLRAAEENVARLQEEVLWQRAALDALGKVHVQIEFAPGGAEHATE